MDYDPDAKTFTTDDQRWQNVIKGNPRVKEFRTKPLKFEEKLDALFLGNSASRENSWIPTENTTPPFDISSMGSALHGVDCETETAGTLVSH